MKNIFCALALSCGVITAQGLVPTSEERKISVDELNSVLAVSGSEAQGTAFVTVYEEKPYIVTNQHVLSGQSNLKIQNGEKRDFRGTRFVAATDADIAFIELPEVPPGIFPLALATDVERIAKKGDEVLVPGNSEGGGVITVTPGKVVAVGPKRIEVDAPVFPGNSGGPIYHVKSGKVVGVLTEAEIVSDNHFTAASMRDSASQIKREIRYFGHRVDTVGGWESMDWRAFHKTSRAIARADEELGALIAYLHNDPSWKEFGELHRSFNDAKAVISAGKYSSADKLKAQKNFLRNFELMTKTPLRRLKSLKSYYIHTTQKEILERQVSYIQGAIDIANEDTRMLGRLMGRY